jgi:molybdate transport system substrate-binding protein
VRPRGPALTRVLRGAALALGCVAPALAQPSVPPLQVYAAGSLRGAMTELIARSGVAPDAVAAPVFGPAGALADRVAAGAPADLFASADMAQPRRLARRGQPVVLFARSRLCAFSRQSLQLQPASFLDRLLDPKVRVATSQPGADPSGDYAQALFALAGRARPGAAATLNAKAVRLGGAAPRPGANANPAADLFLSDRADVLLSYCSGAASLQKAVSDLVATPAPPALSPPVEFGLVRLTGNPSAARLVAFILSPEGQAILARNGFVPVRATARQ